MDALPPSINTSPLINEPFVFLITMQGRIDSHCNLGSVQTSIQEAIDVVRLHRTGQKIEELLHIQLATYSTKILIVDIRRYICF